MRFSTASGLSLQKARTRAMVYWLVSLAIGSKLKFLVVSRFTSLIDLALLFLVLALGCVGIGEGGSD